MNAGPSDWRRLCELAQSENNTYKQTQLCELARRMIQDRSIALAEANIRNAAEEDELNAALRRLWKLQNRA